MDLSDKNTVIENILFRAAEQIGDITEPVMRHFYQRFPQSRELFEQHAGGSVANLEGEMVERSVHCLMNWFASPGEIEILLLGSVPHHNETLSVPPAYYQGLLTATAEVIHATIPDTEKNELALWKETCDELTEIIACGSEHT